MIKYKAGYKYQLAADYGMTVPIYPAQDVDTEYISLTMAGKMVIKRGYCWDGASGPTVDTKSSMRGALVHDALTQLVRLELISRDWLPTIHRMLFELCIDDGMWTWRAGAWKLAVNVFGDAAAHPDNERRVLTAP